MAKTSNKDIARSIYESSKDKNGQALSSHMENVVKFLARKRLLSKAGDILQHLQKIINKESGVVTAKIKSSHRLATQTQHHLKHSLMHRYKANEVIFDETVDESLIGGFKIEVEDEMIDFTLRNKVNKLQEYLIRN